MASGILALLDDIAAIAKVAAASVDDIATLSAKAGAKSLGVVVDDAAVTPRYVVGFAAERELPIVWKIARGSLRNKLIVLLPGALLLSVFAPWLITPLLMLGGLFLCFEGAEKVLGPYLHHDTSHKDDAEDSADPGTPVSEEDRRVAGAIQTDLILSAEIMAITLAGLPELPFWQSAAVLALVGVAITALVYGVVALIVKADDFGVALAAREGGGALRAMTRNFGRLLVRAMPHVLVALATIGTVAMLWVGGGIVLHGLEVLGFGAPAHIVHDIAARVGHMVPSIEGALEWLVGALLSAILGLVLGAILIPIVSNVIAPLATRVTALRKG